MHSRQRSPYDFIGKMCYQLKSGFPIKSILKTGQIFPWDFEKTTHYPPPAHAVKGMCILLW
jgi:hypothetical protein